MADPIVVAGAGPTGMMLAAELRLAGADPIVLDRRSDGELLGSRAAGLHSRTLEVFDLRGIADRFIDAGRTAQVARFAGEVLDIGEVPTRRPYGLALWQPEVERILGDWIAELGVTVERGAEVVGTTRSDRGVRVALADGRGIDAAWLVGCDGGRSAVRSQAGIGFPGSPPTTSSIIAEVAFGTEPEWGMRPGGPTHGIGPLEPGWARVIITDPEPTTGDPSDGDIGRALERVWGTDFDLQRIRWSSRFTDASRLADGYRRGRVLLAGDAAHIHYPAGGQGLNLGIQDAVNLGWRLARVAAGALPDDALDAYGAERSPIAAAVLRDTMAQVALRRDDARSVALAEVVVGMLQQPGLRRDTGARMSGLDIRYPLGGEHPLVGRRMPDPVVRSDDAEIHLSRLLHAARPALIAFAADAPIPADVPDDVVRTRVRYDGDWNLPVVGAVPTPRAILVRPDGYVAWVGV